MSQTASEQANGGEIFLVNDFFLDGTLKWLYRHHDTPLITMVISSRTAL
jgi:hypothetical protein